MFYSFVEEKVGELYDAIVTGDLYISLDSIKEYVYFYLVADALQSKDKEAYSLYAFTNMLSSSNEVQEDGDLDEFFQDYEKIAYHYTNLNYKKQVESEKKNRD